MRAPPLAALTLGLVSCSFAPDLPEALPPLADVEEPLDLRAEPDDEAARRALPLGSFSGVVVEDARDTLAAKLDQPGQLRIAAIVENSPAAAAGLAVDDLVLEARVGDGPARTFARASEWRRLELDTPSGSTVHLLVDRAGREAETSLVLVPRVRPAAREAGERLREEERVGVVLRTATEVEARGAGLGPGGGAVIVGLSRGSPWRTAGLRFGDLLVAVDGAAIAHPQDLLATLRTSTAEHVQLEFVRDAARHSVTAPFSQRAGELQEVAIPLLFSYTSQRGRTDWSVVYGLLGWRSTAAAWRFTFLWLIGFGGGDADRLLEVGG